MSYIGSTPTNQNFIAGTDYFNGTGSAVNFTMSRAVNSVNDIEVLVNNVAQIPSGYLVSGTTLTFSVAPSAGTSNVYVRYLSTTTLSIAVASGSTQNFNITGNAATVTTNANLTGDVTSVGNATTLANTAVSAGSYTTASITVDAKGRLTAASSGAGGGVTSLVAGNGITVSGATGAVTVSQDFYSGSNINNTSFPVTSYIALLDPGSIYLNSTSAPYVATTGNVSLFNAAAPGRTALAGTWRSRGSCSDASCFTSAYLLMQRTA